MSCMYVKGELVRYYTEQQVGPMFLDLYNFTTMSHYPDALTGWMDLGFNESGLTGSIPKNGENYMLEMEIEVYKGNDHHGLIDRTKEYFQKNWPSVHVHIRPTSITIGNFGLEDILSIIKDEVFQAINPSKSKGKHWQLRLMNEDTTIAE